MIQNHKVNAVAFASEARLMSQKLLQGGLCISFDATEPFHLIAV